MYKSKYSEVIVQEIIKQKEQGLPSRKIAKDLLGRKSAKSTVNDIYNAYLSGLLSVTLEEFPKILVFDVEVAPTLALAFPRFKAFISPEAVIEEPYMLTWSARWLGSEEVISDKISNYEEFLTSHENDYFVVESLRDLLDEADIVIAHNENFDFGWISQQICKHGIQPHSPVKHICTLKALKKAFTLPSNSLQAACQYFGLEGKLDNVGMELWKQCKNGNRSALEDMEEYNRQDVVALTDLYYKILPFIHNHPNVSLYFNNDTHRCPRCSSKDVMKTDKYSYTGVSKFEVYQCNSCSSHIRGRVNVKSKEERSNILTNSL